MWMRPAMLAVALVVVRGLSPHPPPHASVALEKLRLDAPAKAQVDTVVTSGPPTDDGRVTGELRMSGDPEIVTSVGLNGVNVRRIATATQPLACGEPEGVTATVVAPDSAKGPVLRTTLRRACKK